MARSLHFLLLFLSCLLGGTVARGAGPDDQFIVVYNQIQQADRTPDRETAIHLYQEARQGLEQIRRGYPAWNSRVINFRLRYVDEKLSPLLAARAAAPVPVPGAASVVAAPAAAAGPPGEVLTQLNSLNTEIDRLRQDREMLEARLREALSAQPAPVDPRELQVAVERISSLQATNTVLMARLEAQESERRTLVDRVVVKEAQEALDAARRQMAEQQTRLQRLEQERTGLDERLQRLQGDTLRPLRQENAALREQVGQLRSTTDRGRQVAELAARLGRLEADLEEERTRARELAAEKLALEREVADLRTRDAEEGARRIARLETELAVARADAARQTERAVELETSLSGQREAQTRLEEENATLRRRIEALTAAAENDAGAVQMLRDALAEEQQERARVEAALQAALAGGTGVAGDGGDEALRQLREALVVSNQRAAELEATLAREAALRERLGREKDDLEQRLAELSLQVRVASSRMVEIQVLEGRVRELEVERLEMQRQIADLSSRVEKTRRERRYVHALTPRERAAMRWRQR